MGESLPSILRRPIHRPGVTRPREWVVRPNEDGWVEDDRLDVLLVLGKPVEEQKQRIDLIVVSAVGKREELALEIGKPRCLVREQDATRFESDLVEPG
jgi:hypothetical protein